MSLFSGLKLKGALWKEMEKQMVLKFWMFTFFFFSQMSHSQLTPTKQPTSFYFPKHLTKDIIIFYWLICIAKHVGVLLTQRHT